MPDKFNITAADKQLVEATLQGDISSFGILVERYWDMVIAFALSKINNATDAEDIAQEVFVKLVRKLNTFAEKSSFKTWLYRITLNSTKDFGRKNVQKHEYESTFVLEQPLNNPGSAVENYPETTRLFTAINRLPIKQREAILLVFGEGLTHKETARALRCAETTVSWRIFQARKKIQRFLEREI